MKKKTYILLIVLSTAVSYVSAQSTSTITLGDGAGQGSTSTHSIFIGEYAGYLKGGFSNTFVGRHAGYTNGTPGYGQHGFGHAVAENSTSFYLHAFGYSAGKESTGDHLHAFGNQAGAYSDGSYNLFVGDKTGYGVDGSSNVFMGSGAVALFNTNKSIHESVIIGRNAAYYQTEGYNNTYIGDKVASNGEAFGYNNVYIGYRSAIESDMGERNTFVGSCTGENAVTSDENTYLGFEAGNQNDGSGNVFIGNRAGYLESSCNNKLYIDNTATSAPLIYGEFDARKLYINGDFYTVGNIQAKEVKVTIDASDWADYVFEEDYNLRDLKEVETYIKTNKHLPDIPSADKMAEEGIKLAEMNKLLLQKIEELTLYAIEQKTEVKTLEQRLAILEALLLNNAK